MISALLRDFTAALAEQAIAYCHWKGNYRLAGDAASLPVIEGDFDVLIERRNWSSAIAILTQLNFKLAQPRWSRNTPAMLHYFGFDSAQEKLVHVHLHAAIFSGENFIDSHCYPFTQLLLRHTETCNGFRVPGRGAELLVYVLKVYIRLGSIPDLLIQRLKSKVDRRELQWLQQGAAATDAIALLNEYFPTLEEKLFRQCLQLLNNGTSSLADKFRLARRVRKQLRIWSRFTAVTRLQAYVHIVATRITRMLNTTSGSKMLVTGGATIAFAGPPVSTSVVLANCSAWLSGKIIVRNVDAAKPPSTWLTLPLNALLPAARKFMPGLCARGLASQMPDAAGKAQVHTLAALLYALRTLCLSRDRLYLLLAMRRAAANGWLVFCDHYPLQANGIVGGPRLRPAAIGSGVIARLYTGLRQHELRLYQRIPRPDIAILLRSSLDAGEQHSLQRSAMQQSRTDSQQQKAARLYAAIDCGVENDTAVAAEDVVQRVKKIIWQAL